MRNITRIIVHHSASPRSTTLGEVDRWHRARGFERIGYHYFIEDDGAVLIGRPVVQQGAHCTADKANRDSIGVCLAGNNTIEAERWNDDQKDALIDLIFQLYSIYGRIAIYGHKDVPGAATECPGVDIKSNVNERIRIREHTEAGRAKVSDTSA
jgi:N-acetylmuramoyl-L-alanine amidase